MIETTEALPSLAVQTDGDLAARARGGDGTAFAAIMRRHNQLLYRLARGILQNESEAEEAVQEAYVRAFTALAGFKGEASLSTWLSRIVVNEALGRLRRRRPTAGVDEIDGAVSVAWLGSFGLGTPETAAAQAEIRHLLEAAIDRLPAAFRTVFVLRAVEHMSVEETASCLGIAKETVRTRFFRARRLLRQDLGDRFAAALEDTFPFAGARCDRIVGKVLGRLTMPGATIAAG
jgi:RNA polymerase sigma-70 factor (ECF subfamily)